MVDANTIMLDIVDRSDEVVPTTDRVVKARIVYRVPVEQRDSATVREEQQTSAEIAEGELVNAACVASVRSTGKVMELREDKARWFRIKREAELAKCGFSKDCEGCRVAASGDEVSRPHGKECRERIRVAMMCDDAGQQRLRTAKERLAPAAPAARAEVAQEGQASPARLELAQESRDEEMNEACATNIAENVKPRIEASRDDSTEVTSRMEDVNTPVGGPLVSAEVSSRSEGVLPSRKRGSEEDAMLECADVSNMCIDEMTVILKSLDAASASERVAELFYRNRFSDSAVDMGFERGIAADYATGWMNDNVGQQRLYVTEQRVSSAGERPSVATRVAAAQEGPDETMRQVLAASSTIKASAASDVDVVEKNQMGGEKPVLLIGSPMCCITMIKSQNVVERHARCPGGQGKNFVGQCVRLLEEKEMCQLPGNAGILFLHENLWIGWSRGFSFAMKMSEGPDVHKTKSEVCRAQLTMCSPRRGSCFESKSEYVTEELSMCCCNKDERTKTHVKNVMLMVFRGLKRD